MHSHLAARSTRAALAALGIWSTATAAFASNPSTPAASSAPVVCNGTASVNHPLQVRVQALDPVRRGATVRLRVTTTAARSVSAGSVALVHAGGARVRGTTRESFRAIPVGASRAADFAVEVPATGHRFLVQFQVRAGTLTRGAAFNLMPDGPSEQLHTATAANGDRLLETAARRVTP
jgi:hypothetical protein